MLRSPRRRIDSDFVHFSIRIENFAHVRRAYGEEGARAAVAGICRLLTDLLRADGIAVPEADGSIDVLVWNLDALRGGTLADACRTWLAEFCWLVPLCGFDTPLGPVHLRISGRWDIPDTLPSAPDTLPRAPDTLPRAGVSETGRSGICDLGFGGALPDDRGDWSDRYRRDMSLVTGLLSGIMAGACDEPGCRELALAWQPVCDPSCPDTMLYHEALVRLLDRDGKVHAPDEVFQALERLGFVRVVDHYVVSRVIDELEEAPDVILGANISARSVCEDIWWDQIRTRLRTMPDVARRLVLEITETADLPEMSGAVRFVAGMRRLGCRIALDDFGTGHASIRYLLALSPDLVKIDRFFVRRTATGEAGRDLLAHMIGVGRSLGAEVIVEGVETAEQADIVLSAGGRWQQGYHWGRPALCRTWRKAPGEPEAAGSGLTGSVVSRSVAHGR